MKLISLDLTNYRRFKEASLLFPDGVIGILGMNGVGKSTIIEAIAWALFGNQPTIVRTQKEHLKRFGAATNEVCEVKLGFELDGDKYLLVRKMAGKNYSTTAEVTVNGTPVASTTKAVTALIEAKLGMDYQAFYTSVFAKQKELNALSTLDPNKRKKLILRMLNIDSIDKAMISVRRDSRDYQTRLKELRSMLLSDDGKPRLEIAKEKIVEFDKKIEEINGIIAELEKTKVTLESKLKELAQKRTDQRKLKEVFNKLNNKLVVLDSKLKTVQQQSNRLNTEITTLKDQGIELRSLEPKRIDWERVKERKDVLEESHGKYIRANELSVQLSQNEKVIKKYEENLKEINDVLKKFSGMEQDITACEQSQEKVRVELEELNKKLSEDRSRAGLVDIEIKKHKAKLQEIRALGPGSECPTCERLLGEHYKILEDKFNIELTELNAKFSELGKSIENAEQSLLDAEKRREALNKKKRYLSTQEKEQAKVEQNLKNINEELKIQNERHVALKKELKKYDKIKFDPKEYEEIKGQYRTLEKIFERIIALTNNVQKLPEKEKEFAEHLELQESLLKEKASVEQERSKLQFQQKTLDDLEDRFDEQNNLLKDHELNQKERENEVKLYQKELEKLNETIAELESRLEKAGDYEEQLTYLTKLDSILNKFKSYMISRIAPTLTQFASDLLRELTDGKYNRMEIDNDYNVSIFDQGEEFPLGRFSGGEEDLANLCLRLAISQVITAQAGTTGPSFVIMDEIFGSQDMHRKRNLLQALDALSNKFRQIFLITHIEDVKEYIEYYIQVSENDDLTSEVKVIGD